MLKDYVTALIKSSAVIAAALEITHPRAKKITRIAAGMILICIIMLPIVDIIENNGIDFNLNFDFGQPDYENMTDEAIEAAFERGIEKYIADKYKIDPSLVTVKADKFNLEAMKAERIYVTLSGEGILHDYRALEDIIAKEFTCNGECEVKLDV